MSLKTLFIIALILFFVPIIMGKVDTTQVELSLKNPRQLADTRVLKLVFGNLINDVMEYYKNTGMGLFQKMFGAAREEIEKKELDIKIK